MNGLPSADLPISLVASAIVLQCHTMAEGLDWLPEDGVVLTCADLERIFVNLRALVAGTDEVDPNRSFAVEYKNELSDATWTPLTTVQSTGAVTTATISAGGSPTGHRFLHLSLLP